MSPISISTPRWSRSRSEHGLWVLSDLAYAEIYFGDTPTPSILQVPGAKDVAIEFTSDVENLFDGGLADRLRGGQPPR